MDLVTARLGANTPYIQGVARDAWKLQLKSSNYINEHNESEKGFTKNSIIVDPIQKDAWSYTIPKQWQSMYMKFLDFYVDITIPGDITATYVSFHGVPKGRLQNTMIVSPTKAKYRVSIIWDSAWFKQEYTVLMRIWPTLK